MTYRLFIIKEPEFISKIEKVLRSIREIPFDGTFLDNFVSVRKLQTLESLVELEGKEAVSQAIVKDYIQEQSSTSKYQTLVYPKDSLMDIQNIKRKKDKVKNEKRSFNRYYK